MAEAVVNLAKKYASKVQQAFSSGSIVQKRLNNNVDFIGARTVVVTTVGTVPLTDYDRSGTGSRYGEMKEVPDSIQELTMQQDKSFKAAIDKGNTLDQSINKAGEFLGAEMREVVIPEKDRHALMVLAHQGGIIVGSTDALSDTNIMARARAARKHMVNKRVPLKGCTWWVTSDFINAIWECKQFVSLERLGTKAVVEGHMGNLFGAPVVEVPEDLMPENINFILAHKMSATSPAKIDECNQFPKSEDVSGQVITGRFYFDTFVIGSKANGIYVDVHTGTGLATVCALPTIAEATGAITAATGCTVKYTTDGSDPRYSASAVVGKTPTAVTGTVVKAYQFKDGAYASGVAQVTVKTA